MNISLGQEIKGSITGSCLKNGKKMEISLNDEDMVNRVEQCFFFRGIQREHGLKMVAWGGDDFSLWCVMYVARGFFGKERSYKHAYIQKQLRSSWFSCGHLLGGPMYQNYNYYMHLGCQKVTPFPHPVRHWWSEEVWSLWRALRQRGHSLLLCSKLYSKDIFQRVEYECMNVNTGLKKTSLATLDSWRTVVPSRAKWPTWPLFEGGALARLPDAVMLSTFYHWVLADDFKTFRRCLLESGNPGARSAFAYGSLVNFAEVGMNFLKWKSRTLHRS